MLFETHKTVELKCIIEGTVCHHIMNNPWKFHESVFSGLIGVVDEMWNLSPPFFVFNDNTHIEHTESMINICSEINNEQRMG